MPERIWPDRIEMGMSVSTHPVDQRERSRRGVVVHPGPLLSRVQIDGVPLTFWNFELVPDLSINA